MSFTDYLEDKILDHVFGGNDYTAPSTLYVGLHTSTSTDSAAGTEVSGGSYARQTAAFTVSGTSPTEATTGSAIEFPAATASWGTVTYAGIYDAASGGNLLAYAALTSSKTIEPGDVFRVPAGDLDITLD